MGAILALVLPALKKYLFEIIAVVCITAAVGVVWYNMNNWCNNACQKAQKEVVAVNKKLDAESKARLRDRELYDQEVAKWTAEVEKQKREIERITRARKQEAEKARRRLEDIFKETKRNEEQAQARIKAEIRPVDVVVAPLALVREYNEAVASANATLGGGGNPGWLPEGTGDLIGKTGTFDALAVATALVRNIQAYEKLVARFDVLVKYVRQLEGAYDLRSELKEDSDGKAVQP